MGLPPLKNYPASDSLMSKIATAALAVKPKENYRLTHWSSYNAGLKQRGSLTLWLCEDVAQQWYHQGHLALTIPSTRIEQIEPIIPPRMNAAWWVDQNDVLWDHPRNRGLEQIDQGGLNANRKQWKKDAGYHCRSKAENAFFRWKTIHGPGRYARKMPNQQTQAAVKVAVLNRFIQMNPPTAVKVA